MRSGERALPPYTLSVPPTCSSASESCRNRPGLSM